MWNCCHLGASSVYTIQSCTSLQCHFIQSHIGRVYMCLAVTCHMHFWQNDWDLLCATAVTQGWNGYEIRVSTERWPWRKKISRWSCRDEPGTFQSQLWRSNQWAIPTPTMTHTHTHNHGIPHSNFETVKPLQETSYKWCSDQRSLAEQHLNNSHNTSATKRRRRTFQQKTHPFPFSSASSVRVCLVANRTGSGSACWWQCH